MPDFLQDPIIFKHKVASHIFPGELEKLLDLMEDQGYSTDCPKLGNEHQCMVEDVMATLEKKQKSD
jgi:hypothetical protein